MSADQAAGETIAKDLNGKAVGPLQKIIDGQSELMKQMKEGKPKRRTGTIKAPSGQQYQIDTTEQ
jgi:hypothetical protein